MYMRVSYDYPRLCCIFYCELCFAILQAHTVCGVHGHLQHVLWLGWYCQAVEPQQHMPHDVTAQQTVTHTLQHVCSSVQQQ